MKHWILFAASLLLLSSCRNTLAPTPTVEHPATFAKASALARAFLSKHRLEPSEPGANGPRLEKVRGRVVGQNLVVTAHSRDRLTPYDAWDFQLILIVHGWDGTPFDGQFVVLAHSLEDPGDGTHTVRQGFGPAEGPGGWGPLTGYAQVGVSPHEFRLTIPLAFLGNDDGVAQCGLMVSESETFEFYDYYEFDSVKHGQGPLALAD